MTIIIGNQWEIMPQPKAQHPIAGQRYGNDSKPPLRHNWSGNGNRQEDRND